MVGWTLTIHRLPSVGFGEQVLSVCRLDFNHPPTAVGGIRQSCSRLLGWFLTIHRLPSVGFGEQVLSVCRLDLNDPPTAVGEIRGRQALFRLDLNNPPTAVGGIQEIGLDGYNHQQHRRQSLEFL